MRIVYFCLSCLFCANAFAGESVEAARANRHAVHQEMREKMQTATQEVRDARRAEHQARHDEREARRMERQQKHGGEKPAN